MRDQTGKSLFGWKIHQDPYATGRCDLSVVVFFVVQINPEDDYACHNAVNNKNIVSAHFLCLSVLNVFSLQ